MSPCPNCGGGVAHVYFGGSKGEWRCMSGCAWTTRQGNKKCVVCGAPDAYLCDHPMPEGGTCDVPMCWQHTSRGPTGADIDYCPEHREQHQGVLQ